MTLWSETCKKLCPMIMAYGTQWKESPVYWFYKINVLFTPDLKIIEETFLPYFNSKKDLTKLQITWIFTDLKLFVKIWTKFEILEIFTRDLDCKVAKDCIRSQALQPKCTKRRVKPSFKLWPPLLRPLVAIDHIPVRGRSNHTNNHNH